MDNDAQTPGNGQRSGRVVACDHDRRDTGRDAVTHGGGSLFAWGVHQPDQAHEAHIGFHRPDITAPRQRGVPTTGHGQHTQSLHSHGMGIGQNKLLRQRYTALLTPLRGTQGNKRLWRPLRIGHKTVTDSMQGAHALAIRIKRQLLQPLKLAIQRNLVQPGLHGHVSERGFGRIALPHPALVQAGVVAQGRCLQQVPISSPGRTTTARRPRLPINQQPFCAHAVLRQGAGFV